MFARDQAPEGNLSVNEFLKGDMNEWIQGTHEIKDCGVRHQWMNEFTEWVKEKLK